MSNSASLSSSDVFDNRRLGFVLTKTKAWISKLDVSVTVPPTELKKMEASVHVFRAPRRNGYSFSVPGTKANVTLTGRIFSKIEHVFIYLWLRYRNNWPEHIRPLTDETKKKWKHARMKKIVD